MEDQPKWTARSALACFLVLVAGLFVGSFIVGLILFGLKVDYSDLPFSFALVALPVNETIILGVTLLFARYKGAGLRDLGLKKVRLRTVAVVSVAAVLLFLLALGIGIGEEIVFGPDPNAEFLAKLMMPRDHSQLIVVIALYLVLVGPCEELAFRGFVQRGFENSFGKTKGLLIASVLFGLPHGLDTLHAIVPVFVGGLVLGYVWQQTGGNTTASALMHWIYNSILTALAYFATI